MSLIYFLVTYYVIKGTRGGAVCWGTALQTGRSRIRLPIVSLEFFIDIILRGKAMANTPKNLPRMQCARAIPVTWLGSGSCQARPSRLNTNEWMNNPSGRTMALGLTQPLTEMSTRNISWGCKGGRCLGLTLPHSSADCLEICEPQPPGTLRACPGL